MSEPFPEPLKNATETEATVLLLGQRIDLKAFERLEHIAKAPLLMAYGSGGCVALFRYGYAVLFGLSALDQASFLKQIEGFVAEPATDHKPESVHLRRDGKAGDGIVDEFIVLKSFDASRLQLVAEVLARSEVLADYEESMAASFDAVDPLVRQLARDGGITAGSRDIARRIGATLDTQSKMVGRVEVLDKPEVLWDCPELERFYLRLMDEYELEERHNALERKLALIARTCETTLTVLHNRHSLRVEWYITILIVFEIVLTLLEMVFGIGRH